MIQIWAVQVLERLQATEANCLTPLGWHLAALPLDARLGKLLIFGAMLQCLDPILTIAGMGFVLSHQLSIDVLHDSLSLARAEILKGMSVDISQSPHALRNGGLSFASRNHSASDC